MYNRVCFVDVEDWTEGPAPQTANSTSVTVDGVPMKRYSGLDVRFNIQLDASGWVNEGSVSICGLPWECIQYYMDNIGWLEFAKRRWVRVYAGYEDTGYDCIFSGKVCSCQVTQAPDVWLEMSVMSPELVSKGVFSLKVDEVNFVDLVSALSEKTGLAFSESNFLAKVDLEKKINYSESGDFLKHKGLIEGMLSEQKNYAIIVRNGSLWVVDRSADGNDPWCGKVRTANISMNQIVGMPRFDWPHLNIRTLLYPKFYPFQSVTLDLDSRFRAWSSGKTYYINTITHSGHFRGNGWTTSLQLIDKTRYENNGDTPQIPIDGENDKVDLKEE